MKSKFTAVVSFFTCNLSFFSDRPKAIPKNSRKHQQAQLQQLQQQQASQSGMTVKKPFEFQFFR